MSGWLLLASVKWLARVRGFEARRLVARLASAGPVVRLRMPVTIYDPESLRVGDQVDVGEFTHIRASGGVTIGNRVLIASHVVITSRAHPIALPRWGVALDESVTIEDDVWIGAGAIILPGVTIGRGAIVAAGAVVTRTVAAMTVVAGVPAAAIGAVPSGTREGA